MKKIPVKIAKQVALDTDSRQVILLTWDGKTTHVVTYGKTIDDCSQAADGGNMIKELLGWPKCNDQPSRVKKLEGRVRELEAQLAGQ